MAVGLDSSLPARGASPLQPRRSAPMQAASPGLGRPPAISDAAVQGAVNNQMAAGFGAREMALSDADRRGMSRGKGQRYAAQMAQDAADVKGSVGAAQTEMAAAAANAQARQAYDSTMRNEQIANAGLLEGLRNNDAMERLAGRNVQQDMYEAYRRGQFGLDQQQLDWTPLLSKLLD